jgi:tetratricopeptide (TPR) repeat protein
MSFIDRLFGRRPTREAPSSESPTKASASAREVERAVSFATAGKRPFDTIAEALQAWEAKNVSRAEELFEQGIGEYKRQEPDGADFALGRYGAFLRDQGREDEAARVLEQAIDLKTDIPAIWSDYVDIIAKRREVESFKRAVERMAATSKHRVEPEFVLAHAIRADREGAPDFGEAIARWVVERSEGEGDKEGRWAAIGDLGRILEHTNRLDEAVQLWRDAFDQGSRDPETASRLCMQLERAKDYAGAVAVIREALNRGLPANVEESLRKRLARCEDKTAGKSPKKSEKRDVAAYSVRRDSGLFEPIFQVRLKPAVKDLELVGPSARCLLSSKEASTLVDMDLASGAETRRVESLPLLGDTWFAPDGRGIGIRRTAAIGKGPTLLRFLGADGRVVGESSVPDATSEIALGPDLWYVGCRNGLLYAFGLDGKQRWIWETPGSRDFDDNAYFRPCPYYVASLQSFAAVASMGNIYAVSVSGKTLWHAALPNEKQTRWEFTVPIDSGHGSQEAFRTLGLQLGASRDAVKSAYRRLALATHPDRHPGDEDAASRFRAIQGAYERILAAPAATAAGSAGITVSLEIQGLGPTASFLAANAAGVVVGSSQGRLYVFDSAGSLREARVLGDGPVRAAIRPDGTVGAAWCSDALLFFKSSRIVNATEALEWPRALTMLGDDVVLWRGNEVQVMDADGRLLWAAEFSKTITAVAAHDDTLVCAAGVLTGFRRRRNG